MLVRLPVTAGLDIVEKGFGVSGGEKGFCKSCSTGGDAGVWGKGFSRLRRLVLAACLTLRGEFGESLPVEDGSEGEAVALRSPVCMFDGLCLPPEIDPNLRMPFRTPAKKSTLLSTSSSVAESDEVENLDSSEPAQRIWI